MMKKINLSIVFVLLFPSASMAQEEPTTTQTPAAQVEAVVNEAAEVEEEEAAPAIAQTAAEPENYFSYRFSERADGYQVSDMRLDADGNLFEQNHLVWKRTTFSPYFALGKRVKLNSELLLVSGYVTLDAPNEKFRQYGVPRNKALSVNMFNENQSYADQFKVRQFYVEFLSDIGMFRVGRMTSNWGLGLLANNGDGKSSDWGHSYLGADRNYGDVVNRFLFATKPFSDKNLPSWLNKVNLVIAADLAEREYNLSRADGDMAYQGVGALRYKDGDDELGFYGVYRNLSDRNDDYLKARVIDLYGKSSFETSGFKVFGAGEVAYVSGNTSMAKNNAFTDNIAVKQLGYLARLGSAHLSTGLGIDVEAGYASGDSNPNDGNMRAFSFDNNTNPSLILFDQLRYLETVAAAAHASDPEHIGYPQDSVRLLPNGGSVSNTVYLRPTLRFKMGKFKFNLAYLKAQTEEENVDPYNSNLAGGTSVNFQGGSGQEKDLGYEINAGIGYSFDIVDGMTLDLDVQAGLLKPGAAFHNAAGTAHDDITLVFASLAFHYDAPHKLKF